MWAFAICKCDSGSPVPDEQATPFHGYACTGRAGNYGAFLVSGSLAQLQAINALPEVYGICLLTTGGVRWGELDNTITPALRTRINIWLAARGYATIPAGWTNRQVVLAVCRRLNPDFDLRYWWVKDQ